MNLIIKKYTKFENLRRIVGIGIMFSGGIGLLWAVLYWRNDIKFTIGVILIHIICGAILSLCIVALSSILRIKLNPTSLLGFLLGVFWIGPILLYKVRLHYLKFDVSTQGFFIAAILISMVSLFGFLSGYFLEKLAVLQDYSLL